MKLKKESKKQYEVKLMQLEESNVAYVCVIRIKWIFII